MATMGNSNQGDRGLSFKKPWIFIDRVISVTAHKQIVTEKLISNSDYFLKGHFPDYSVYPGLLLSEAVIQSAALLMHLSDGSPDGQIPHGQMEMSARFLLSAFPGDTIVFTVDWLDGDGGQPLFTAAGKKGDEEVVRIRLRMPTRTP